MELSVGIKGNAQLEVTSEMLASSVGSGVIDVFATPWMVALMENAAQSSVAQAIGDGNVTVGTKLDIAHTAATPLGMKVHAESKLIEIDGRRLVFEVQAFDEREKIGEGIHERFIVSCEKFLLKCNEKKL